MKGIEFLEEYRRRELKKMSFNTVNAYVSDLKQFLKFIKKDLEIITDEDVKGYTAHLLGKSMKPKTVNRKLVSLRRFINYLNGNVEFKTKIHVEIELIKIQRQEYLAEILSKTDVERLLRLAERNNDFRAIALFNALYLTGVRVSELLQFKVSNAKQDSFYICGKGSKYREVLIPDRLKGYFADYIRDRKQGEDSFLFLNEENDNQMDRHSVHRVIKKYAGLSKVKLTKAHAHNFRHLCGILLAERGLTIDQIASILGHTDINTTKIYTQLTKSQLINLIKDM